jgi:hypothetical protein
MKRVNILLRKMKVQFGLGCFVGLLSLFGVQQMHAQQLPISDNYLFNPRWMNPAMMGTRNLNHFMMSHQQRKLNYGETVRSMSQFLNFSSAPLGRTGTFGWGGFLNHDIEHTEQRISVNVAFAAKLIYNSSSTLSVGINGGLINWGSNYTGRKVYDRDDILVANPTNFADLDAGLGIRYSFNNYFIRTEANLALTQLPGNLISNNLRGIWLNPHLLGGGNFQMSPDNNFYVGPMLFYRNTVLNQDTTIKTGQLDAGLKVNILQWGLWFGGAYRIGNSAFTGGFGLKLLNPDTLFEESRNAFFLDLNASASYPLNESSTFGPSFEIGLSMAFGRVGEYNVTVDTLQLIRGSFWKNDGNINTHRLNRLNKNAPSELAAITEVTDKNVTLTYEWDDNMYRYVGENPEPVNDTLLGSVGREWIGVDGILSNIVTEVIREALHPDTSQVANPDSLEPLKSLILVELNGKLKATSLEADFGAQGTKFLGMLPERLKSDTLRMLIEYDGYDTLIVVHKNKNLSNLELACLKLHAMRKKLEYEINKYFSKDIVLLWEGAPSPGDDVINSRSVVYLQRPKITSNNPNQKPFIVPQVKLVFTRYTNYFQKKAEEEKGKVVNKEEAKLQKQKKKRKNQYRVLVE